MSNQKGATIEGRIDRYFKVLKFIKKNGKTSSKTIEKEFNLAHSTAQKILKSLKHWGWVLQPNGKGSSYIYCDYNETTDDIKNSISKLKSKFLRNPTIKEICIEMCKSEDDADIRKKIKEVGYSMGWDEPDVKEMEKKEKLLREVLKAIAYQNFTAVRRKRYRKEVEKLYKDVPEEIKEIANKYIFRDSAPEFIIGFDKITKHFVIGFLWDGEGYENYEAHSYRPNAK